MAPGACGRDIRRIPQTHRSQESGYASASQQPGEGPPGAQRGSPASREGIKAGIVHDSNDAAVRPLIRLICWGHGTESQNS